MTKKEADSGWRIADGQNSNEGSTLTLSRRLFIGAGLSITALPLVPASAAATDVKLAIFDERFSAASRFGRSMASQGAVTIGINGDVTRVWLDHLDPVWRSHIVPAVAGLTTQQALFCLERLCWDRHLRVIERIELGAAKTLSDERSELLVSWVIARRDASILSSIA
jgi:hypothetical protein